MGTTELKPLHPVAQTLETPPGGLRSFPPAERWDDWEEYDPVEFRAGVLRKRGKCSVNVGGGWS